MKIFMNLSSFGVVIGRTLKIVSPVSLKLIHATILEESDEQNLNFTNLSQKAAGNLH